jgi:hypothetical protein
MKRYQQFQKELSYLEEVGAELLEPRPGDGGVEVDALEQGVNLDAGLCR